MPLIPKNRGVVPPGGLCRYIDPDDGWQFEHPYYDTVKEAARMHRVEARLSVSVDWDAFFDEQFCRAVPQACVEVPTLPAAVPPPLATQAKEFARSMVQWAMSGFRVASFETLAARQQQCAGSNDTNPPTPRCPNFTTFAGLGLARCGKCGCSTLKLYVATERCPIGKWGPV